MNGSGGIVAATAQDWATWLGIPTAIIVAAIGPIIQRRAQERRDQAQNQGGYVGQLIKGYEGRIADLRTQIADDKAECQEEIARERRQREAEVAAIRVECEERVNEAARRSHAEIQQVENKLTERVENYRRDRDYWKAKAEGRLNGRGDDSTPPPENRPPGRR